MNKDEVVEVLKFIYGAYPKFQFNEETPKVWTRLLGNVSYEIAINRVINHIKTSSFEPNIHHILKTTEMETRHREVEFNRWVSAGNEPSEFKYNPNAKH